MNLFIYVTLRKKQKRIAHVQNLLCIFFYRLEERSIELSRIRNVSINISFHGSVSLFVIFEQLLPSPHCQL